MDTLHEPGRRIPKCLSGKLILRVVLVVVLLLVLDFRPVFEDEDDDDHEDEPTRGISRHALRTDFPMVPSKRESNLREGVAKKRRVRRCI